MTDLNQAKLDAEHNEKLAADVLRECETALNQAKLLASGRPNSDLAQSRLAVKLEVVKSARKQFEIARSIRRAAYKAWRSARS